jgi:ribosomal-protein-alanine N-acetyltransferase
MSVRDATEQDQNSIIKIVESIHLLNPSMRPQFNWDRFQIRDELRRAQTLVYSQNEVTAFLCYRETADFFEITVLATSPETRKQGQQTALIKALTDVSRQKNKSILLEVHEENLSAINFYRKQGFVELPARKNYYTDGKSALVFQLKS